VEFLQTLAEQQTPSTHTWYDGTSNSITMEMLYNLCLHTSGKIYINQSMRNKSFLEEVAQLEAMASFLGLTVEHWESYKGKNGVRNMLFVVFNVDSKYSGKSYSRNWERIGTRAWLGASEYDANERKGYYQVFTKKRIPYFMGRTVGMGAGNDDYAIQFYTEDMQLNTKIKPILGSVSSGAMASRRVAVVEMHKGVDLSWDRVVY
jgi:hypothetical protein